MPPTEDEMVRELSRLRHGQGLADSDLRKRLGPGLTQLAGITRTDTNRDIRQKLMSLMSRLSGRLDDEDRAAADHAFGLVASAQHAQLGGRVERLADQERIGTRTARRRIDRATRRLAEEAAGRLRTGASDASADPERGWHVARFEALMRLDTAAPELTEIRTIEADQAPLRQIAVRFSLPRHDDLPEHHRDVEIDVQFGARLIDTQREGDAHFRLLLGLPRELPPGTPHTYSLTFRLPRGQVMRPYYAFVPLVDCELFRLRVRFDGARPPKSVWRLDRVPPNARSRRPDDALQLDLVHEVFAEFDRLDRGFAYGVAWIPGDGPD